MAKTTGFDDGPESSGSEAPAPRETGDIAPGTQVGEYLIEGTLGRGGMGTVYAAHHPVIGKRVAIKVLAGHLSGDPTLVRRFIDEARAVNKIGHPNIIDIFAFGQLPDKRHYFVMELLEGETLSTRLEAGSMALDEARHLLVQAASALEAAHQEKIVHRDLKPENIWIARPKHSTPFIKILDFGIAKLLELTESRSVTETGVMFGTPYFMSPEQCLGENVDARTDIYALGVILYRVFGGKLPFTGRTFAEVVAQHLSVPAPRMLSLRPQVPGLEDLILGCLEKDPGLRPQTAAEVGRRLDTLLAQAPTDERTPEPVLTDAAAGTRRGYGTASAAAKDVIRSAAPPARPWARPVLILAIAGAVVAVATIAAVALKGRTTTTASSPTQPVAPASPPTSPAPAPTPVPPAVAPAEPPIVDKQPGPRPEGRTPAQSEPKAPSRADKRGLIRENPFR